MNKNVYVLQMQLISSDFLFVPLCLHRLSGKFQKMKVHCRMFLNTLNAPSQVSTTSLACCVVH